MDKKTCFLLIFIMILNLTAVGTALAQDKEISGQGSWENPVVEKVVEPQKNISDIFELRFKLFSTPSVSTLSDLEEEIHQSFYQRKSSFSINYTGNTNTLESDISGILSALFQDEYLKYSLAGYNWSSSGVDNGGAGNVIITFSVDFLTSLEQENYVDQRVSEILAEIISSEMDSLKQVKAVNDYIVLNARYGTNTAASPHSAYALLVESEAVCQGYTLLAYKMIEELGFPVRIITGNGHSWNMVYLNNEWYHLDVTWNDADRPGQVQYSNFLMSNTVSSSQGHEWETINYPAATCDRYSYFHAMREASTLGDYIYYSNVSDNDYLYKSKIDGTGQTQLNNVRSYYIAAVGDWLYFANYSHGGYLCKIKTDGSKKTLLVEQHVKNINVQGNKLYYTENNSGLEKNLLLFEEPGQYDLTIETNGHGTTNPTEGSTYDKDTPVILTASPSEGWGFNKWVVNETEYEEPAISIVMDEDKTATAYFSEIPSEQSPEQEKEQEQEQGKEQEQYTLTIETEGQGTTNPLEGDTYDEGTSINLEASPSEGWGFDKWVVNETEYEEPAISIIMDEDKTATAYFSEITSEQLPEQGKEQEQEREKEQLPEQENEQEQEKEQYILTIETEGQGTTSPLEGDTYDEGTSINLEASPSEGWEFDKWVVNETEYEESTISIGMDEDKTATAYFSEIISDQPPEQYKLTIETEGQGTTAAYPAKEDTYEDGTNILLAAKPSEGWEFDKWELNGTEYVMSIIAVVMDEDKTVKAYFTEIPLEQKTLTIETEGQGAVAAYPAKEDANKDHPQKTGFYNIVQLPVFSTLCNGNRSEDSDLCAEATFNEDTDILLKAKPSEGWEFDKWELNGTEYAVSIIAVAMDDDKTAKAYYTEIPPERLQEHDPEQLQEHNTLTIETEGQGIIATYPAQENTYEDGTEMIFAANPSEGWKFDKWVVNGSYYKHEVISIIMTEDKIATAFFTELPPDQQVLALDTEVQDTINSEEGDTYEDNTNLILTAD